MPVLEWLLGTFAQETVVAAAQHAGRSVFGSEEENAVRSALSNAVRVTVNELVTTEQQRTFAADAILELLHRTEITGLPAGNLLTDLEAAVHEALGGLWASSTEDHVDHATLLGLSCAPDRLSELLVSQLVSSLGQHATALSAMGSMVALLQTQQSRRALDTHLASEPALIQRGGEGSQAVLVNAWVSLAQDPPCVIAVNGSDAPIFDVCPTPALVSFDERGEPSAMVGHGPLETARQIDPHGAWVWPLEHCRGWGGQAAVKSQMHMTFTDNRGRGWLLAHDFLSRTAEHPSELGP